MAFSTIDKSTSFQNQVLYTGTGSEQAITGVNFQPDMIWQKGRSDATSPSIHDAVRGATWEIYTSATAADANYAQTCKSFDSDGFTVGTDGGWNASGQTKVGWCWKAGTTTGIAGSPSITPLGYSFNATSGFSAIKYEGTGSAATLPHGLGVAPSMIIVKALETSENWAVYHKSLGATKYIELNLTAAAGTSAVMWNDTEPTSTLFTVNTNGGVNTSGNDYIAYCFAETSGYSKFSSFIGNGSLDGTFCYTGFRPSFVMLKCSSAASSSWVMLDNKRSNSFNDATCPDALYAESNSVESTASPWADLVSNGFKCRGYNEGNTINKSGETYIYAAFGQPIISNSGVVANAR